jgi:hypothetical protein
MDIAQRKESSTCSKTGKADGHSYLNDVDRVNKGHRQNRGGSCHADLLEETGGSPTGSCRGENGGGRRVVQAHLVGRTTAGRTEGGSSFVAALMAKCFFVFRLPSPRTDSSQSEMSELFWWCRSIVFGRRHVSAAYLTRIVMIAAGKLLFQS